jgi:hypothetical protein
MKLLSIKALVFTALLFVSIFTQHNKAFALDSFVTGLLTFYHEPFSSSDWYGGTGTTYAGRVMLAGNNYYWAVTSTQTCYGFSGPSTNELQMLTHAITTATPVVLYYKMSGSFRCLTGVALEP